MQRWIWILIVGCMALRVEAKIDPEHQATISQAAEAAGLRRGDVIREINRRPMRSIEDYKDVLAELKPGDEVGMIIRRESRRQYANFYAVLKVPK